MTFSAPRAAILLLLLAAPLAAETTAPSPSSVVYPAASGVTPSAFGRDSSSGFSPLAAVGIAACAGAGLWLWWRGRQGSAAFPARGERRLVVAETRPLGNRQYLVVAAYDDKRYLLGVCPGRIELLAPLDAAAPSRLP